MAPRPHDPVDRGLTVTMWAAASAVALFLLAGVLLLLS